MNKICKYLLPIFLSFCYNNSTAQKTFNVTIQFPKDSLSNYQIYYDNGKLEIPILISGIQDSILTIKRKYFSEYASLIIRKQEGEEIYQNSFFINESRARIIFYIDKSNKNPLENYKLNNALDFKEYKIGMHYSDSNSVREFKNYDKSEKLITPKIGDSLYYLNLNKLMKDVYSNDLNYILSNPKNYYSLWFFRRNILSMNLFPYDSLLKIYNSNFSSKYRKSIEGQFILNNINGNIAIKNMGYAPLGVATDINGVKFDIKKKLEKKEILIIFGATWCAPCLKEIPVIQNLLQTIPSSKLDVLYVAYNSSLVEFRKMVETNKMRWINIYNDIDLINSFGGYKGIPRMYMLDKTGKIIYVNQNDETYDFNFNKLKSIFKNLYYK